MAKGKDPKKDAKEEAKANAKAHAKAAKGEKPEGEAGAEGEDGEGAPKKKKLPIMIIAIVAGVLVLGGGGAGAYFLFLAPKPAPALDAHGKPIAAKDDKKKGGKDDHGKGDKKKGGKDDHGKGGKGGKGGDKAEPGTVPTASEGPDGITYVAWPDTLSNIQGETGKATYLKLKLTFECADEEAVNALTENQPRIEDALQGFLRELRPEDIAGSQGNYQLRLEILRRINLVVAPYKINAVLIEEMLLT
jgi:flagellar protein FliL